MSLAEELGLSLKDLLPKEGRKLVRMNSADEGAIISDRLYVALAEYAKRNALTLSAALAKLRDEIHGKS